MWRDENAWVKNVLMFVIHWFGILEFISFKENQLLKYTNWSWLKMFPWLQLGVRDKWPQSRCTATNIFGDLFDLNTYEGKLYIKMMGYSWEIDWNHDHQHFIFKI